ncbi:DUF1176 domain-containing protein [Mesorhizobium sp. Z1-4]|uniref:DUF1176 domain-containing protein n=1 Tax=Mesorhizobium sp. Z1-4 TaxID=2448478 RepID=UPI000FD75B7F|nr:DUF1176 domain-containing protein [Mesorhizobium sp. Z1-4]
MRLALVITCGMAVACSSALAEEAYLDDRSDAASLVKSLYNAVNRKEYARAWSYFSEPPASSLEDYAEGFSGTESVKVRTGRVAEEGAAGSIMLQLPLAIEAHASDGSVRVFSGCYSLRMANPEIATDAFTPLSISSGRFSASSAKLDESVPANCDGGAPLPAADLLRDRAIALWEDAFAQSCQRMEELTAEERTPETYDLSFRYAYETASDPEHTAKLFRFPCNRGAYNESEVYIYGDEFNELRLLSFATPHLDIRYQDDDFDKPVDAIYVIGFKSVGELVNSEFDPATNTLHSWSKWRGVGDASSRGEWLFRSGEFSLVRFDVDASYDGEINPRTVVDYASGP